MLKNLISNFTDYERTTLLWGLTVSLGYMITHFYPEQALTAWPVLLSLNVVNYLYTTKLSLETDLNFFWLVFAVSIAFIFERFSQEFVLPLIGAIGFYYTGLKTEDASHRLYETAAILNLATILIFLIGGGTVELFLLLAFVQGAPMIIDFFIQ